MLSTLLEWKKVRRFLEYAVYLILTLLLQGILFSRISVLGVKGMLMPAAVSGAAMYLGGVRGAVFGIFMGLFTDMNFSGTTVLFTLLFPVLGFFCGMLSEFYINKNFYTFMAMGTAACLITCVFQLLLVVIGHGGEFFPALFTAILQTLVSIIPMALLYLPFRKRKENE